MRYPRVQYGSGRNSAVGQFSGLNRTERAYPGEWADALDLDTEHYPCIAPRRSDSAALSISYADSEGDTIPSDAVIAACATPPRDVMNPDTYHGFTGVIRCSLEGTQNYYFSYKGVIQKTGTQNGGPGDSGELWVYNDTDGLSDEELAAFDITRIEWTIVNLGARYVINGFDPVLRRGRYYTFDPGADAPALVSSAAQSLVSNARLYRTSAVRRGYSEYSYVNTITSDSFDFSAVFSEGDYLMIKVLASSNVDESYFSRYETHPYITSGTLTKYAVIREVVTEYNDSGSIKSSVIYYYTTRPTGKHNSNSSEMRGARLMLGTFVPPMAHIASFGTRIWGVDPDEDRIYASVFDTPHKLMNTDAQLDVSMSWSTVLGGFDSAKGVIGAGSELLVLKSGSLVRINGASAASFGITGIFRSCGCLDIHSAAEIGGIVIYLGSDGFYAYDGSRPMLISEELACRYTGAAAFGRGMKYYANAVRADNGETEFLVYDLRRGIWHKWSGLDNFSGAFVQGSGIYAALGSRVAQMCCSDEVTSWSCVSPPHYESENRFKGVNELWIRARIDEGTIIRVYTSVNGGGWKEHKTLEPKGRVFLYKLPVRLHECDFWQYKLVGTGGAVILNIERVYDEGGGRHYADK